MGAVTTHPITIEEFDKLDLPKDRNWELHNGELVEVSFANAIHNNLQHRVRDLLMRSFPDATVLTECAFKIEETNDKRAADVGLTTKERNQAALNRGILIGAPELVAEVLSPSNGVLEMKQYRRLCFTYGTKVFLIIDPEDNTVEVCLEPNNRHSLLKVGDILRLTLFGTEASIPIASIFAGITLPEAA